MHIPGSEDSTGPIAIRWIARWLRLARLVLTVILLGIAVWQALGPF